MFVILLITISWMQGLCLVPRASSLRFSKMKKLYDKLCPAVDICNMNATNADILPNRPLGTQTVSCCTGCSCHPECRERSNCCYPNEKETNINKDQRTRRYQCLDAAIANLGEALPLSVPAYYTVVTSPAAGCVTKEPVRIETDEILHPTCENKPGRSSFLPVYSKLSGEIYKNLPCALCHGMKDIQNFIPALICRKDGRTNTNPFSELSYLIDTGKPTPRCYVLFWFSEPKLLSEKRCYHSVIDTCQKDRVLTVPGLGLSQLDMSLTRELCENGLYSPFLTESKVYMNVFCYLCGNQLQIIGDLQCSDGHFEKSYDSAFMSLLDPTVYLDKVTTPRKGSYPEACLDVEDLPGDIKCYNIYCPLGRTMGKDGQCVFVTTYLTSPLDLFLKLLSVDGEDLRLKLSRFSIEEIKDCLIRYNPWQRDWKIRTIYLREDNFTCDEQVYVHINLMTEMNNFAEIVPRIQHLLSIPWRMMINDSDFVFTQSLRDDGLEGRVGIHSMATTKQEFVGCNENLWKPLPLNPKRFKEAPVIITKLYFCHQIQIEDFNRTGFDRKYLESNMTTHVLARYEFKFVRRENGYQARVCLDDTILKMKHGNIGVRQRKLMSCVIYVLSTLIVILQI